MDNCNYNIGTSANYTPKIRVFLRLTKPQWNYAAPVFTLIACLRPTYIYIYRLYVIELENNNRKQFKRDFSKEQ